MNVDKIKWSHWTKGTPTEIISSLKIHKPLVQVIWVEHAWQKHRNPKPIRETKPSKQVDEKKLSYYKTVWSITERNACKLKDNNLRGKHYHLDHIVPISYGYKHSIKPSVIGALKNIRIITMKENFKKNRRFVTL
jgi:hypothetical protein